MHKIRWMSRQNNTHQLTAVVSTPIAITSKKLFFIDEHLCKNSDSAKKLHIEVFLHPGKGKPSLFITNDDCGIMEILEFVQPYRSWFLQEEVCSSGSVYLTTFFDVNFLALYYLRQHCASKFLSMNEVHDNDASIARLMRYFIKAEYMKCFSDIKIVKDEYFYKYNHEKSLCWLSLKTRRLAEFLRCHHVHCGQSAVSRNFIKSEKLCEKIDDSIDYLRMACDYVGSYLTNDLYEEFSRHFEIHYIMKTALNKRKSVGYLHKSNDKKQKLSNGTAVDKFQKEIYLRNDDEFTKYGSDPQIKVKASLNYVSGVNDIGLCSSLVNKSINSHKQCTLSAKNKSLAKSARGTQNISKFFIKKIN